MKKIKIKGIKFVNGGDRCLKFWGVERYWNGLYLMIYRRSLGFCFWFLWRLLISPFLILGSGLGYASRWIVRRLTTTKSLLGWWVIAKFAKTPHELEQSLNQFSQIPTDSQMSESVRFTDKTFFTGIFKYAGEGEYCFCAVENMPQQCVIKKWLLGNHTNTWLVPVNLGQFVFIR